MVEKVDTDGSTSKPINTQKLSEIVNTAAARSGRSNNKVPSLAQLRLANMKLHGRENDMKLLRSKLLELKKRGKEDGSNNSSSTNNTLFPELILISGISGTGKSALVMKGLRDPAQKMGINFTSGKFDLNNTSLPLSAFVDAMASLTSIIIDGDNVKEIHDDIEQSFAEDDASLLIRALPGCEKLFTLNKDEIGQHDDKSLVGKEAISRLQYAIRKLLKIMCTHLNGLVLFIDDLQVSEDTDLSFFLHFLSILIPCLSIMLLFIKWSVTVTLDLLQSISMDSDIPNLLIVGAYREDEVSE